MSMTVGTTPSTTGVATPTGARTHTSDAPAAPQDGYSGSVETPLQADEVYGDNPALSTQNAAKEMGFGEVALAAFCGVAAFYCCCAAQNKK